MVTRTTFRLAAIRLGSVALFGLLWQAASWRWASLPDPIAVLRDVLTLLQGGFLLDLVISIRRVVVSVAVSFVLGVSLGLLSARVRWLNLFLNSTLVLLIEALPPLAWTIICILVVGIGEATVLFVVCIILVQFFVVNVVEGLKNLDRDLIEMARSFPLGQASAREGITGAGRTSLLRYVELGMMTPYLLTATRLAYGVAWKVIVVAEMFGASEGVGYRINQAYSMFSLTRLLSLSTLIVAVFFVGDCLFLQPIDKRLRAWQVSS